MVAIALPAMMAILAPTAPSIIPIVLYLFRNMIGDGACDGLPYNTEECGWDGGDCAPCDDGYFGPNCTLYYPNCSVPIPQYIGDGVCDGCLYNTTECGWDGGDCLPAMMAISASTATSIYPNCSVPNPEYDW